MVTHPWLVSVIPGTLQVEVEVESMDKAGNFIGWLHIEGVNLSVALVEQALSRVHFTAERSPYCKALLAAQDAAKQRKEKVRGTGDPAQPCHHPRDTAPPRPMSPPRELCPPKDVPVPRGGLAPRGVSTPRDVPALRGVPMPRDVPILRDVPLPKHVPTPRADGPSVGNVTTPINVPTHLSAPTPRGGPTTTDVPIPRMSPLLEVCPPQGMMPRDVPPQGCPTPVTQPPKLRPGDVPSAVSHPVLP